jgi:hypothetical protein
MEKPFNKKIEAKHFIITLEPWKWDFVVCLNYTGEQVNKVLKKYSQPVFDQEATEYITAKPMKSAVYYMKQNNRCPIMIIKAPDFGHALCCFAHEQIHAIHDALGDRGLKLCDETEEAYAYTNESMMKQFLLKM